jgi:hypothetical protein
MISPEQEQSFLQPSQPFVVHSLSHCHFKSAVPHLVDQSHYTYATVIEALQRISPETREIWFDLPTGERIFLIRKKPTWFQWLFAINHNGWDIQLVVPTGEKT